MIKQVIVLRTDLNMRKGKMAAQAAHASMKVFFDRMYSMDTERFILNVTPEMKDWIQGRFTKIVVGVPSLEKLIQVKSEAEAVGIPCALIEDCGVTEFHGVTTATAVAVGPAEATIVDRITGDLTLL
jgi:PTH2 family peptidyl-tRNA hydrolase